METGMIDVSRHAPIFDPFSFNPTRVDVIGVGATGSEIVWSLAKLGILNIHVWDFDTVEKHNIANQIYGRSDIGRLKVEALYDIVKALTGTELQIHPQRVEGTERLGQVVFLLTDSMASRKDIFNHCIKNKVSTKLLIETRMASDRMMIFTMNPMSPQEVAAYERTLYDSKPQETSPCGTSITVGPTAKILANMAVWQLIHWAAIKQGKEDVLPFEILIGLNPYRLSSRVVK